MQRLPEQTEAVSAEQARQERNRNIGLIAMAVVLISAVVAAGAWYGSGSGTSPTPIHLTVAAGDGTVVVGKASAPVKVTIYEDFLCPSCKQLEDSTRDYLRENAASGTVQVTYHPINLLTATTYSARALNAWAAVLKNGTPRQALTLHDLFFENQPYATDADSTTNADIAKLVTRSGATGSAVTVALSTTDTGFLTAAQQAVVTAKVTGTPTIYLNGKELAAAPVADLVTEIENAVDAAS
ncbi:MAG: oxidoreductase [Marmoricola sp.]|nr:oxidoreductase [Marmoricola sp.]